MSRPSARTPIVGLAALSILASGLAAAGPAVAGTAAGAAHVAADGAPALARAAAGIETVGPIATVAGSGSRLGPLPLSVAIMPRGSVTNGASPWLAVPSLAAVASVPVRVRDTAVTGAAATVFAGSLLKGWVRIAATLRPGGAYDVEVSDSGNWVRVGGFTVSIRSTIGGPTVGAGDLSASLVTGDVAWGWSSAGLPGPVGGVSVRLTWASGSATGEGLPDGWRLTAATGSPWSGLTESATAAQALRVPGRPVAVRTDDPTSARLTVRLPERLTSRIDVQRRADGGPWRHVTPAAVRATAAGLVMTVPVPAPAAAGRVELRVIVRDDGVRFASDPTPVRDADLAASAVPAPSQPIPGAGRNAMVTGGAAPAVVTLTGWDGSRLVFVRSPLGVYEQPGGSGAAGFTSQLTRESDGVWEFTDAQGVVTRFVDGRAVSVRSAGEPLADLAWDAAGRLTSVTNEIGLAITLGYAGAGTCPSAAWTGSGFIAPPAGLLCRIDYPDGTRTDIGYVAVGAGAQIGLVKDPGNTGTTLGWDSVGRLVSTRSALATRTVAVDPAAAGAVARVEYDSTGRATALVDAPASPGGTGARQLLTLPTITEADLRAWVGEPGATNGVQVSVSVDESTGYTLGLRRTVDPISWATLRSTDASGLELAARTSDSTSLISRTRSVSGLVTSYDYNELGLVEKVEGPVVDGRRGYSMSSSYDATSNGRTTTRWSGLRAQVYAQPQFAGDDITREFWAASASRGGLSAAWRKPATFSAQAAGVWTPAAADDTAGSTRGWTFSVAAAGGTDLVLLVDSQPCVLVSGSCTLRDLPTGPKAVSVQIRKAPAAGWFQVSAAPAGATPGAIPFDAVSPGYALVAVSATNDQLPGSGTGASTTYAYDDPASGRPSSIEHPGDLVSTMDYEDLNTEAAQWGRLTTRTTPGGQTVRTSYWPTSGSVSLPTLCGGGTVRTLGLPKTVTRHDGTTRTLFYDLRGRTVAIVDAGPDSGRETACITYAEDGGVASTATFDAAGALIERTDHARSIGGDPRVSGATVTHGPAAIVNPGGQVTSRVTVDLHGDPVREVGISGAVTTTVRDILGNPTRVTMTPPPGSGTSKTILVSTYNPEDGRLATVTVNDVLAATLDYSDRTGRLQGVSYPDGIALDLDYGVQGLLDGVTVTSTDPRFTRIEDTLSRTAYGRITGAELVVTGTSARTEDRAYDYDEAGRLASASITTTRAGQDPVTTSFGYSFDTQADSCGSAYADAGMDNLRTGGDRGGMAYTTCYDDRGRAVSTTDPQVTGGAGTATIGYDGLGRATSMTGARPVTMQWQRGTILARMVETAAGGGAAVTTTLETYGGVILDKKVATSSGAVTARYAGAYLLDRSASGDAAIREVTYTLPGGARITTRPGAKATLTLNGADGAALVTLAVPALSTGAAPAPGGGAGLADRYGPYGEPLEVPGVDSPSVLPDYGWRSGAQQETLAGTASVSLIGERPYHPALGLFLAPDPNVDAGDNLYGYTDGDPINQSDVSGRDGMDQVTTTFCSVLSAMASIFVGLGGAFIGVGGGRVGAALMLGSAAMSGLFAGFAAKSSGQDSATSALIGAAVGIGSVFTVGLAANKLSARSARAASERSSSVASGLSEGAMRPELYAGNLLFGVVEDIGQRAVKVRPTSEIRGLKRALSESRQLAQNTARFQGETSSLVGIAGKAPHPTLAGKGVLVRQDLVIVEDVLWEARSSVRSSEYTLAIE